MAGRRLGAQVGLSLGPAHPAGPLHSRPLWGSRGHPALPLTSPEGSQALSLLSSTAQTFSTLQPRQGARKRALDPSPLLRSGSLRVQKGSWPTSASPASALGEVISFSQLLREKTSLQVGDRRGTAQSKTLGRGGEQLGEQRAVRRGSEGPSSGLRSQGPGGGGEQLGEKRAPRVSAPLSPQGLRLRSQGPGCGPGRLLHPQSSVCSDTSLIYGTN